MRNKPGDEDTPTPDDTLTPDDTSVLEEQGEGEAVVEEHIDENEEVVPDDTIIVDENFEYEIDEDEQFQLEMRKRHVASVRNKAYIFVLGVVLFMFWPMFLSPIEEVRGTGAFSFSITDPINSIFTGRGEGGLLSEIEAIEEQKETVRAEIDMVNIEKNVIENLNDQEKQNTLIRCLNTDNCSGISDALLKRVDFLRIFIMINELISEKMNFDQKEILRNIYEFILTDDDGQKLGTLQSINFGSVEVTDESLGLVSLPITLGVTFAGKAPILTFLDNTENRVFMETPIMYVIDSMNYNIVDYTEEQEVQVSLTAYFFASEEQLATLQSN